MDISSITCFFIKDLNFFLISSISCENLLKSVTNFHFSDDTGYPHDGRADNAAYRHDRRADKRRYPHDREIDIQRLK